MTTVFTTAVACFLCKANVPFSKTDKSRLISHLEGEHMAFFGTDYLIAGCTMSGEERTAIQVVGIIYLLNYPRSSHLLPTLRTW